MKLSDALLVVIALLLAVNAYFSYLGALTYGVVPEERQSGEQKLACATSVRYQECPKEWHLKGGERPYEFETGVGPTVGN